MDFRQVKVDCVYDLTHTDGSISHENFTVVKVNDDHIDVLVEKIPYTWPISALNRSYKYVFKYDPNPPTKESLALCEF